MPTLVSDSNPRPPNRTLRSKAVQEGKTSVADVSTECIDYRKMMADWQLVTDLWGGTKRMREAGARWLPQEPKEEMSAYMVRLNRSTFFNAFKRAIAALAGRPFSKPITYSEDLDDNIKEFLLDADLNGRHMDVFLRDVFVLALRDGMRHVLVDKSPKSPEEVTAADEQRIGRRPYCVDIDPRNLTFWQYELRFGHPFLTQVRIKEAIVVADGDWGQKEVTQYRVLRPGSWEIWRKQGDIDQDTANKEEWTKFQEGTTDLNYIPLITVYTGRAGFMVSGPPLVDLAWENVHHWQSRSDQNHILHIARVPVWFARGLDSTTSEGRKIEYVVSPNAMITASSDNADLKIVEHTGRAIEAGNNDLKDCEDRMAVLGTELLQQSRGTALKTATEVDVEAQAQYSELGMMVRGLEDAAESIIEYMGDWENIAMPDDKYVTINKDFTLAGHIEMIGELTKTRAMGDLSQYTYLQELKRLGGLGPNVNVDDELDRTAMEAPRLMDPLDNSDTQFDKAPTTQSRAPTLGPGPGAGAGGGGGAPGRNPGGPAGSTNRTRPNGRPAPPGKRTRPTQRYAAQLPAAQ